MNLRKRRGLNFVRNQQRDAFASMSAINAEVAVQRKHDTVVHQFGHPHQACVSKRHRYVGVSLHRFDHAMNIVASRNTDLKRLSLNELQQRSLTDVGRFQQEPGFGNDCLASQQRCGQLRNLILGPAMPLVAMTWDGTRRPVFGFS